MPTALPPSHKYARFRRPCSKNPNRSTPFGKYCAKLGFGFPCASQASIKLHWQGAIPLVPVVLHCRPFTWCKKHSIIKRKSNLMVMVDFFMALLATPTTFSTLRRSLFLNKFRPRLTRARHVQENLNPIGSHRLTKNLYMDFPDDQV